MIEDHVCSWVENLGPRVRQFLFYQDALDETLEKINHMAGRDKINYEMQILGDFFTSDFYNADFDPWPDSETRIDKIEDLQALADNDLDRKKLENSVEEIFHEASEEDERKPARDPQQEAFFSMMTDAFGINEFYNTVERSKTEVTEILAKDGLPAEAADGTGAQPDIEYDAEGAESLKSRLADILDGHIDSF